MNGTPRPWAVNHLKRSRIVEVVGADGSLVCEITYISNEERDQVLADAALMVAAVNDRAAEQAEVTA